MRAMSRAVRGSGFRGVLEYAITRNGKKEKGQVIGGNMEGTSPRELSAEFGQVRNLRQDIEKPVSHNCLRLPQGERLTSAEWSIIADDFMSQMGFTDKNQRVYVLHDDADGQHIHLIANRIGEDGKIWLGKNENLLATKIINSLELKYSLRVTVEKAEAKEAKEPKKQEAERAKRKNEEPPRIKIQKAIDKIFAELKAPIDIADFNRQMKKADIWLKINRASTGKINGFAFDYKGVRFKGSDLGKSYSLVGLEKRGLVVPKTHKEKDSQMNAKNYIFNDTEISEFERKRLEAIRLDGWYHSVWRDKTVYKKDGQAIEDRGSKIIVDGSDYQKLAVAAVELALKKGWRLEDIKAGGEKEFVEEIAKEIAKRQNQNATQNIIENVIENDTKKDTKNDDNDGVKHNEKSWDEVVEQIITDNYDGKPIEEALKEVEAMAQEPDRGLNV